MRKIIALEFITLDGVIQAPGGPEEDTSGGFAYGGWTAPYFDDTLGRTIMGEQMAKRADLLLGRVTYDIFASYWPGHESEWPGINDVTKYVVSKNLTDTTWNNSVVLRGPADVKKIKNGKGPDIQTYGSANLIQTLMRHDLIDEFRLSIFPVTLGEGKRLFGHGTVPRAYTLAESVTTPSGVIFAHYRKSGDVKTGSVG